MSRFALIVAAGWSALLAAGCSSGGGGGGGFGDAGASEAGPELPPKLEPLYSNDAVCARWAEDRADLDEGSWSGDVASCTAGEWDGAGRANALRQINLYRWLAGRNPVVDDAGMNALAQSCALVMDANDTLSHNPPETWTCYTTEGAEGAKRSNITLTRGVDGVDAYMIDHGEKNALKMGHRRWILWDDMQRVGLGSTNGASCLLVVDGPVQYGSGRRIWPPPGAFPYQAYVSRQPDYDVGGWTIEIFDAPLDTANVVLTEDGVERPILVNVLEAAAGSDYGLRFVPSGWNAKAGSKYEVTVTGIASPFRYEVELVVCP